MKDSNLHFYLNQLKIQKINFMKKINLEIVNENIILLIKENNYVFRGIKLYLQKDMTL